MNDILNVTIHVQLDNDNDNDECDTKKIRKNSMNSVKSMNESEVNDNDLYMMNDICTWNDHDGHENDREYHDGNRDCVTHVLDHRNDDVVTSERLKNDDMKNHSFVSQHTLSNHHDDNRTGDHNDNQHSMKTHSFVSSHTSSNHHDDNTRHNNSITTSRSNIHLLTTTTKHNHTSSMSVDDDDERIETVVDGLHIGGDWYRYYVSVPDPMGVAENDMIVPFYYNRATRETTWEINEDQCVADDDVSPLNDIPLVPLHDRSPSLMKLDNDVRVLTAGVRPSVRTVTVSRSTNDLLSARLIAIMIGAGMYWNSTPSNTVWTSYYSTWERVKWYIMRVMLMVWNACVVAGYLYFCAWSVFDRVHVLQMMANTILCLSYLGALWSLHHVVSRRLIPLVIMSIHKQTASLAAYSERVRRRGLRFDSVDQLFESSSIQVDPLSRCNSARSRSVTVAQFLDEANLEKHVINGVTLVHVRYQNAFVLFFVLLFNGPRLLVVFSGDTPVDSDSTLDRHMLGVVSVKTYLWIRIWSSLCFISIGCTLFAVVSLLHHLWYRRVALILRKITSVYMFDHNELIPWIDYMRGTMRRQLKQVRPFVFTLLLMTVWCTAASIFLLVVLLLLTLGNEPTGRSFAVPLVLYCTVAFAMALRSKLGRAMARTTKYTKELLGRGITPSFQRLFVDNNDENEQNRRHSATIHLEERNDVAESSPTPLGMLGSSVETLPETVDGGRVKTFASLVGKRDAHDVEPSPVSTIHQRVEPQTLHHFSGKVSHSKAYALIKTLLKRSFVMVVCVVVVLLPLLLVMYPSCADIFSGFQLFHKHNCSQTTFVAYSVSNTVLAALGRQSSPVFAVLFLIGWRTHCRVWCFYIPIACFVVDVSYTLYAWHIFHHQTNVRYANLAFIPEVMIFVVNAVCTPYYIGRSVSFIHDVTHEARRFAKYVSTILLLFATLFLTTAYLVNRVYTNFTQDSQRFVFVFVVHPLVSIISLQAAKSSSRLLNSISFVESSLVIIVVPYGLLGFVGRLYILGFNQLSLQLSSAVYLAMWEFGNRMSGPYRSYLFWSCVHWNRSKGLVRMERLRVDEAERQAIYLTMFSEITVLLVAPIFVMVLRAYWGSPLVNVVHLLASVMFQFVLEVSVDVLGIIVEMAYWGRKTIELWTKHQRHYQYSLLFLVTFITCGLIVTNSIMLLSIRAAFA